MIAVAEPEYENIADEALEDLREEVEPKDVELKKTRVDTTGGDN
ncbi:MAG: hypothetical protein ABEJ36_05070 [Candidatus Nanosalina sp.]